LLHVSTLVALVLLSILRLFKTPASFSLAYSHAQVAKHPKIVKNATKKEPKLAIHAILKERAEAEPTNILTSSFEPV
jgi:hypothetical protein